MIINLFEFKTMFILIIMDISDDIRTNNKTKFKSLLNEKIGINNNEIIINNDEIIINNDEIGINIEKSIYNFAKKCTEDNDILFLLQDIYDSKIDELYVYLNNDESKFLINALLNNTIDPLEIASLSPDELNPLKYEKIINKKKMEDYNNSIVGSNAFTCSKCKTANCIVTQKQTRSGDEAPTTFVKCIECGYSFKL